MKVDPTSIIHPSSKIDDSVEIGPFCIIGEDVEIKKGTKLLSHVVLKGPTTVGEDNIFINFQQLERILQIRSLRAKKLDLKLAIEIFSEKVLQFTEEPFKTKDLQ